MAKWLTKSDYLKFLIHPAYLWLQKYDKTKLPAFDDNAQAVVDQGNIVERYARELFPGGHTVKSLFTEAVRDTEALVRDGAMIIFQATALTPRNLFLMADVLVRNDDGSWDIYEIKSATREKAEYLADLAFQKVALEEAGYAIRQTHLIHINNRYVRQGDIDPSELFCDRDLTDAVAAIVPTTRRQIEAALKVLTLPVCPDVGFDSCRSYFGWRDIWRSLQPPLPDDSVYNLCRLNLAQVKRLQKLGVTSLADVPVGFELGTHQLAQLAAFKAGTAKIKATKIAQSLRRLTYPIYFLDYETTSSAVPMYEGTRPYQQIPFQYSLHVLEGPDGPLRQTAFLARGGDHPAEPLLAQLEQDLGPTGSVVVWNKAFEMGVNDDMGRLFPTYRSFLKAVNARVFDLMEIFSNGLYADARFFGSASIKNVLPVLVPELSYKSLGIQEGMTASRLWTDCAAGRITGDSAAQIYADLEIYCGQDTLAMVRIYEVLLEATKQVPEQVSLLS